MNVFDARIEQVYGQAMANVDLNLIKTFVLIYQTRSATKTAESLYVTQPSVSHALRRLRSQFNDPLFIRSADGLAPTELAREIYPQLHQALGVIEDTVSGAGHFDPAVSEKTFRLRWTDLGEIALLPDVLATVEERAPHCAVLVAPLDYASAADDLRQDRSDAVICVPRIDAPDLRRDALFKEGYLGLCASTHPRIDEAPTMASFMAERHIAIDTAAGHGDPDQTLVEQGHRRTIAVRVPHFAVLPELVARTQHLAVVPARVATLFTRMAPVRTFQLPWSIPQVQVGLFTLRRVLPAPEIEWLRNIIVEVLRDAVPPLDEPT